jgi:hypothetical protein
MLIIGVLDAFDVEYWCLIRIAVSSAVLKTARGRAEVDALLDRSL